MSILVINHRDVKNQRAGGLEEVVHQTAKYFFFFQAEVGIRDGTVTGVQTCALPISRAILHPTLPIRILDPTSEAVLLVVRACLELRRLDPMTLCVWQARTRKFALDRAELAALVDRTTLCDLAAELLSEDLAELVADAFYGEQPLETQMRLRLRMRKHCAAYRSYNAVEARVRNVGQAL